MARLPIAILAAALVLAPPAPANAGQYEASLIDVRSLRYQATFGLAEDDHDAFFLPRSMVYWDGSRLATNLTRLSPAGEASFGYGRGVTDGWSWSGLAGGGYSLDRAFRTRQDVETAGSADQTSQVLTDLSSAEEAPTEGGTAQVALGMGRRIGEGVLALGVQARWRALRTQTVTDAPALFALPSPASRSAAGLRSVVDLDSGELFEETTFLRTPSEERRTLQAAFIAGYGRRPASRWGWSVDLLAGVEQTSETAELVSEDRTSVPSGSVLSSYRSDTNAQATYPLVGLAFSLVRDGRSPLWIDLGGEYATGGGLPGDRGGATAIRQVALTSGGVNRLYEMTEERFDSQAGTLGRRARATLGMRQLIGLDSLTRAGWGLHGTWTEETDDLEIVSTHRISESLDANGNAEFDDGDILVRANGEMRLRNTLVRRTFDVTLPVVLLITSPSDPALEWRFGSELRYRNRLVDQEQTVDSIVLPSGLRVDGTDASAPVRYANAMVPTGRRLSARHIDVSTTLRAGLGYWFSSSAKIDVLVSAVPDVEGLSLEDHTLALSALLAF